MAGPIIFSACGAFIGGLLGIIFGDIGIISGVTIGAASGSMIYFGRQGRLPNEALLTMALSAFCGGFCTTMTLSYHPILVVIIGSMGSAFGVILAITIKYYLDV